MRKRYLALMLTALIVSVISCSTMKMELHEKSSSRTAIIPKPEQMVFCSGEFAITHDTKIMVASDNYEMKRVADFLRTIINRAADFPLDIILDSQRSASQNAIILEMLPSDTSLGDEGYFLAVTSDAVRLQAYKPAGIFYGVQTIRQLLPVQIEGNAENTIPVKWAIPCVTITDKPRFRWRGMMLDVCRHYLPIEFIKKSINFLALYKMNTFHWHLTEDQGWRMEIKRYPKLTEIGAWRKETVAGDHRDRPQRFDGTRHGGYYTQEEIKEIVAYARERYITIVPEIEMPGHCSAALAAYPEFSCSGGPFEVQTKWGVFEDVYCAGNDSTFLFLEQVLSEVIELFPSPFIHIGGDECPKKRWQACPHCQARIRQEQLNDEHALQSYFIKRIEKFLNSKGRKLVGWDEILEGGIAPDATIMSWQGVEGGIAAAKQGHHAVMSPITHCYFNLYQGLPQDEPSAFGGYIPLKKVYSFEPIPDNLTTSEAQYILGAQANLWTEYISTPDVAEYMLFPRLCAFAEVVWTPRNVKNWDDFTSRMEQQYQRLDLLHINCARSSYRVNMATRANPITGKLDLVLETETHQPSIYFALDGSIPTIRSQLYQKPVELKRSSIVKAAAFQNDKSMTKISEETITLHNAIAKQVHLKYPCSERYTGGGEFGLTDCLRGSAYYADGRWKGFEQVDFEAVVDLKDLRPINKITVGFLQQISSWIFLPLSVEYAISGDGVNYKVLAEFTHETSEDDRDVLIKEFVHEMHDVHARFVRIIAQNIGVCPAWHAGAGNKTWVFVDEILIE